MRLPILSLLFLLAMAAPAAADSLVYVKDGNLYSARPDGSEQRQLTQDGSPQDPYSSPTQADDGTIVAIRGSRFHKFDRNGRSLGPPLDSVLTRSPAAISAVGPFDARISPDGSKIAYWLGIMGGYYDYGTNTYYEDPESAVVYQSAADGTPLGQTMFHEEPSWLGDSSRLLLWESMNGFAKQVSVGVVGADHNHFTGWFHDSDTHDYEVWNPLGAGELTRSGNRLAALRAGGTLGDGYMVRGTHNSITIYDVSGFDRAPALWPCRLEDENGGELTPPHWSPDGSSFTWSAPDGIWTARTGNSCQEATLKLVIPGGREPDWGSADPGGSSGPAVRGDGARAATVKVRRGVRRAALLRRGMAVKVTCAAECRVDVRARKLARGRAKGSGTIRAKVRLTGRGRRAVKHGARRLALRVKVRQAGTPATTYKRAVKIRG